MDRRRLLIYALAAEMLAKKAMSATDPAVEQSGPSVLDGDADDILLRDLLALSWQHEAGEGDMAQLLTLQQWAERHGLTELLPAEVEPDGDADDPTTQKASSLIVAKAMPIQKAWGLGNGDTIIEGWVSTEDEDQDKDIVPPEAFKASLPGYASRRMPLSSEHGLRNYPIGHGQRIALVRDGVVFAEASHPTDDGAFEHFPGSGTGVYGRFVVTEHQAADAVAKGNIGGFSWVGRVPLYDRRASGKGRIFKQVDPWMESTIAAYPINHKAVLLGARFANHTKE